MNKKTAKRIRDDKKIRAATAKRQAHFLSEYARGGVLKTAAITVKAGRATVYKWLHEDKRFKQLFDEATEDAVDLLESEARRRAVTGVDRPIYQGGELVGYETVYSDNLLITLLKGRRADVFRERHELTGKNGKDLYPTPHEMDDEELYAFLKRYATAAEE